MFLYIEAGLPPAFAPIPGQLPYASSGGRVITVGTMAAVVPHEPLLRRARQRLSERVMGKGQNIAGWTTSGEDVVPDVHGGTFVLTFNQEASLGPEGRTMRYNVDPVPSTSGASVQVVQAGQPIAPSGPSVATQPWPRSQPVWPIRRWF